MKEVGRYLREHAAAIRERWLGEMRTSAVGKPTGVLVDHLPELLDRMARCLDVGATEPHERHERDATPAPDHDESAHDPGDVVTEYHVLRSVVLDFAARSPDLSADARARFPALASTHDPLDHTLAEAVERRAAERDRAVLRGGRADEVAPEQVLLDAMIARSALRMARLVDELVELTRNPPGGGVAVVRRPPEPVAAAGDA